MLWLRLPAVAAPRLDAHEDVSRVYYPGLGGHPDHVLAAGQMDDFGGTPSFELDASLEDDREVLQRADLFALVESLGGAENPIEQPATMTRAPPLRNGAGTSD